MAYFNLDLDKIKNKIKEAKRETIIPVIRVAVIFLMAIAVIAIVLLRERPKQAGDIKKERASQELTEKDKKDILESLSAPPGAKQYSDEEKRQILESLSAPSGQLILSEEEKKKILDSLSSPQE